MEELYNFYLEKVVSYKDEVDQFFIKNEKNIENRKKLTDTLFQNEFKLENKNYNDATDQYNEFMHDKQEELKNIEDFKRKEKAKFWTIEKKIQKNIDFLKSEKNILSDIHMNLEEYRWYLESFLERFKQANTRISELLTGVVEYESSAKKEIDDELVRMKESIWKFFEAEKEKLKIHLNQSGESIIQDKFLVEKLKISQDKKDNLHFDLNLFVKYTLLLGLILWVAIVDFWLVQTIVIEEFNLSRSAEPSEVFLVHYIIPFLPSFVLIFAEFLVLKYLWHKKLLRKMMHIFALIVVLIVLLSVFFTINGTNIEYVEPKIYDLVARILIFVIAIPVTVSILVHFFKTHEFFNFIRHIFLVIFLPILCLRYFFEHFILKKKKDSHIEKTFEFKMDMSELSKFQETLYDNTTFLSIPRTFHDDLNKVSLKTEKAISDIQQLQSYISKRSKPEKKWFFSRVFWLFSSENWSNSTTEWSIDIYMWELKKGLQEVIAEKSQYDTMIEQQFEKEAQNIEESIQNVEQKRKVFKEDYENKKKTLLQAIHDGIQQIT